MGKRIPSARHFEHYFVCFMVLRGLLRFVGIVVSILIHGDPQDYLFFILVLLVAVYKLFFNRFVVWSKRYKLYVKTYGVTEWIRSTEFLENEIILTDHTTTMQYRYDQIAKIKEKNNIVMLFFKNKTATRLYKDAFIEGSWQECREPIARKAGI